MKNNVYDNKNIFPTKHVSKRINTRTHKISADFISFCKLDATLTSALNANNKADTAIRCRCNIHN